MPTATALPALIPKALPAPMPKALPTPMPMAMAPLALKPASKMGLRSFTRSMVRASAFVTPSVLRSMVVPVDFGS